MSVSKNLQYLKEKIPSSVCLVAVSKTKPVADILEAYKNGQKVFGENKAIELKEKAEKLTKDIKWHMIGHLQRNKVKYIAPFVDLIHSIDSIRLLQEVNKRGSQNNRSINCLLQVRIAKEETKFGFDEFEIQNVLKITSNYQNINIVGLMGMASFTSDEKQIRKEFKKLKKIFDCISNKEINILSMGMSSDYKIAIEEGSNMVRVGSAIFGKRN